MKYAIISDVHGNAPALRLALDDAREQGAEGFLFAGDYCISAPWPNEAVDLIRALPNAQVIRGNNDDMYVFPDDTSGQYEIARWCRSTLTEENRQWLHDLPAEMTLVCEGVTIRMAHSSEAFVGKTLHAHYRTSSLTRMYPDGPVSHERLLADFRRKMAEDADFMAQIDHLDEGVYVFGHNHIQSHGDFHGRLLIDPGGCGDPLDCGECCTPYTLLTIENGRCTVTERRIPYDPEPLISQVRRSEQYAAARVWSELMFASWRTRREKAGSFIRYCVTYAERIGDIRRPFARDTWEAAFDEWQAIAPTSQPELFVH